MRKKKQQSKKELLARIAELELQVATVVKENKNLRKRLGILVSQQHHPDTQTIIDLTKRIVELQEQLANR